MGKDISSHFLPDGLLSHFSITEVMLQDFLIRGKAVYLKIRRRRWRHKTDPKKNINLTK